MIIERTSTEVIIRLSSKMDTAGLQNLIDYLTYLEATANSQAEQSDVDELVRKAKKGWWTENKKRLVK